MKTRALGLCWFLVACGGQSDDASGVNAAVALGSTGLPLEDVSCEQREPDGTVHTWTYDVATRTLNGDQIYITFNEAGRYLKRGDPSGQWAHEYSYDEHGGASRFVYSWGGAVSPTNSSDYTRKYEGDRLTERSYVTGDGSRSATTVFSYEAGRISYETTTSQSQGMTFNSDVKYRYDAQGRVEEVERNLELTRFGYNAEGRLTSQKQDGFNRDQEGPDGTPEIERHWYYDAAGHITRFTLDGTTAEDNPEVDGTLDIDRKFSSACTALLVLGRDEIFYMPPAPGSDY